jgi:hypothetical protein
LLWQIAETKTIVVTVHADAVGLQAQQHHLETSGSKANNQQRSNAAPTALSMESRSAMTKGERINLESQTAIQMIPARLRCLRPITLSLFPETSLVACTCSCFSIDATTCTIKKPYVVNPRHANTLTKHARSRSRGNMFAHVRCNHDLGSGKKQRDEQNLNQKTTQATFQNMRRKESETRRPHNRQGTF